MGEDVTLRAVFEIARVAHELLALGTKIVGLLSRVERSAFLLLLLRLAHELTGFFEQVFRHRAS